MHAHPYSSKFPAIPLQGGDDIGCALADDGGDGARFDCQLEFTPFGVGDAHAVRQWAREMAADEARKRLFAPSAGVPPGHRRVGVQNSAEQLRRSHHCPQSIIRRADHEARRAQGEERI